MNEAAVNESAIPVKPAGARPRVDSIDVLRGLVMVIMALDHVRDFMSRDALLFDPTDLTQTRASIFLTRWITHFCAPVFCFLAGTGIFLSFTRGKSRSDVARFLVSRGLWLVFLELTVVQFSWLFHVDVHQFGAATIWSLGWSMVAMAGLIYLPLWGIAAFGIGMIVVHNAFDRVMPQAFGSFAWLWSVLHVESAIPLGADHALYIAYPLVPWIGVMAAGYALGALMKLEQQQRRTRLLWLGIGLCVAFVALRAANIYGDMRPWTAQTTSLFNILSFLNCTKYPPSLLYLLMTLGPAIVALWLFDRKTGAIARFFIVFGRVPLFYYLLHLYVIHGIAVLLSFLKYGRADWLFVAPPWDPKTIALYPQGYGLGLAGIYAIWLIVIGLLYPVCRWFAELKQRRRDVWLSYL